MDLYNSLEKWGWTKKRTDEFLSLKNEGWSPGRVLSPGRGIYRITDGSRELDARLTGKSLGRGEAPAAGDWIAWREEGGTVLIGTVLHRQTLISRKVPGETTRQQVMAANVDILFVVQALGEGRSFTPRGLERYVTMAWESGCRPVVILNKSDLSENPEADRMEAEAVAPGVEVFLSSSLDGTGIDEIRAFLSPGQTAAFVGPSGAGKSSILNAVAGSVLAETGDIREGDRRGRHTTTRRELHRLPDGRLLLDTPGLRELQLWGDSESVDAAFPEIEKAAEYCRFKDCRHEKEPGCAVLAALEDGSIEADRFDSWLELRKEVAWLEARRDEKARKEFQQKGVEISKIIRHMKNGKEVW